MIRDCLTLTLACLLSVGPGNAQSISDLITQLTLDVQKLSQLKSIATKPTSSSISPATFSADR